MMRYPYTERHNDSGDSFYSPTAPVRIIAPGGGSLVGPVLLDTGCDRTHITGDVAERLGVDVTGLGERTMVWGDDWETIVVDAPPTFRAVVGNVIVPLRPVIGRDFGSPVLGMDFLEHFRATFDGRSRTVELDPHDNVPRLLPDGRLRSIEFPAAA